LGAISFSGFDSVDYFDLSDDVLSYLDSLATPSSNLNEGTASGIPGAIIDPESF
jgi:hypothetical protein